MHGNWGRTETGYTTVLPTYSLTVTQHLKYKALRQILETPPLPSREILLYPYHHVCGLISYCFCLHTCHRNLLSDLDSCTETLLSANKPLKEFQYVTHNGGNTLDYIISREDDHLVSLISIQKLENNKFM